MSQDTAGELLLPAAPFISSALFGALLWIPLRDFAILKEGRVATTFHFIELSADLLQGTQFSLKVDVVVTTCLHRLYQFFIQLSVFGPGLTGDFSSACFLFSG